MTQPTLYQAFADYNQQMNAQLYEICATMPDDQRKLDKGAFFKSIHSTLDHLLLGDRAWMNRLSNSDYTLAKIGVDLYGNFDELAKARAQMDSDIITWVNTLDAEWLASDLVWTSSFENTPRTQPRWLLLSHMFNHQTHHRGQLSTLLNQAGYDLGVTDLPRFIN